MSRGVSPDWGRVHGPKKGVEKSFLYIYYWVSLKGLGRFGIAGMVGCKWLESKGLRMTPFRRCRIRRHEVACLLGKEFTWVETPSCRTWVDFVVGSTFPPQSPVRVRGPLGGSLGCRQPEGKPTVTDSRPPRTIASEDTMVGVSLLAWRRLPWFPQGGFGEKQPPDSTKRFHSRTPQPRWEVSTRLRREQIPRTDRTPYFRVNEHGHPAAILATLRL